MDSRIKAQNVTFIKSNELFAGPKYFTSKVKLATALPVVTMVT